MCDDALEGSCLAARYAERLDRRWTTDQLQILRQQRMIQRLQAQLDVYHERYGWVIEP